MQNKAWWAMIWEWPSDFHLAQHRIVLVFSSILNFYSYGFTSSFTSCFPTDVQDFYCISSLHTSIFHQSARLKVETKVSLSEKANGMMRMSWKGKHVQGRRIGGNGEIIKKESVGGKEIEQWGKQRSGGGDHWPSVGAVVNAPLRLICIMFLMASLATDSDGGNILPGIHVIASRLLHTTPPTCFHCCPPFPVLDLPFPHFEHHKHTSKI